MRGLRMALNRAASTAPMACASLTSCDVKTHRPGTRSVYRVPNHRTISAAGFADGSMARRPSEDTDGVISVSRVARSKNCRSADCSRLS